MTTFRAAPTRSNSFATGDAAVVPPSSVLDSDLPNNLTGKRTAAHEYRRQVHARAGASASIKFTDIDQADDFSVAVEVATLVPSIARRVGAINNAALHQSLTQLTTAVNGLTRSMNRAQILSSNSTATEDADTVIPPHNDGDDPVIAELPTTIQELRTINDPALAQSEAYLGIIPTNVATLQSRRKALRRKYGVVMITQPATGRTII